MRGSPTGRDGPIASAAQSAHGFDARLLEIIPRIGDATTTETALMLFREALAGLEADAGVFMSCLKDSALRASLRSIWACDPVWTAEYAMQGWFENDPWLQHATHDSEPILASGLKAASAQAEAFLARAENFGFASALIAPAPSGVGLSRVGMLCIGSRHVGHFECQDFATMRVLTRALAMEMHRWLLQHLRQELLRKSRVTDADIELLRQGAAGHSSKVIGAALNVEAKTIDCRFQRVNAKLGAPDRRTALRIARLYGVI